MLKMYFEKTSFLIILLLLSCDDLLNYLVGKERKTSTFSIDRLALFPFTGTKSQGQPPHGN